MVSAPRRSNRDRCLLVVATLVVLLPFVGKPFHIDDPMYVWSARHIVDHPLDFYGFTVNWDGYQRPVVDVMQNPPLVPYLMAGAAAIVGWSEVGLHSAFALVAVAAMLGIYQLALPYCRRPLIASLLVLACPGFLVSATTLMCEIPLLCLWVWAIVAWRHGLAATGVQRWALPIAGLLIAAAVLAKYPGMNLVPLLALHAVLFPARRWSTRLAQAGSLLIPLLAVIAYDRLTAARYGHGLLSAAAGFANGAHGTSSLPWIARATDTVAFVGATGLAAGAVWLAGVALTRPGRAWRLGAIAAAVALAGGVAAYTVPHTGIWSPATASIAAAAGLPSPASALSRPWFDAQFGLLAAAGVAVLFACADDLIHAAPGDERRQSLFLVAWVAGVLTFALAVNWAINVRTLVPLVPAVCILAGRAVGRLPSIRVPRAVIVAGGCSFAIALVVAIADDHLARANRQAAVDIARWHAVETPRRTLWMQGHWGFQYYLDQAGVPCVDLNAVDLRRGDLLAMPIDNYGVGGTGCEFTVVHVVQGEVFPFVTTMNAAMGAGFFGSAGDALPFTCGLVPTEPFVVMSVVTTPTTRPAR